MLMEDYSSSAHRKSRDVAPLKKTLVFTGGVCPPPARTARLFSRLGTPDFVIAADSGLKACLAYAQLHGEEYMPDIVCGDFDSLTDRERMLSADVTGTAEIAAFPADKDYTDTELALRIAEEEARKSGERMFLTLAGGSGGRADHFIGILDLFASDFPPDLWITEEQCLWLLRDGRSITISGETGTISAARTTESRTAGRIISDGLEWESPLFRKEGMPSISNRRKAGGGHVVMTAEGADFIIFTGFGADAVIRQNPDER